MKPAPTTLLFDAGNTRFKWALVDHERRLQPQQATPLAQFDAFEQWLAQAPRLERVVGVSVAAQRVERALRAALRRARQPAPELLTPTATAAGVSNGYREPESIGADRWAAAVAAWHRAGCYRTVCAVSVGTALTLDLVDQDGRHRGGLIAPGPTLMLQSLLGRTEGIASRAASTPPATRRRRTPDAPEIVPPLADFTRGAIDEGCLAAAAGFIDRTVNQLTRRLGVRPVVFITGGAAPEVIERMHGACKPCDDLVLRGVAAIAAVPIRRRA